MFRRFEYGKVYQPTREWIASGDDTGSPWEDVYFDSLDGVRLNGWFFPNTFESPHNRVTMLICHGNGGNISYRTQLCRVLLRTGINVFVFDYRGYGRSEGRADEEGTYCDAQGAYRWLRERGYEAPEIAVLGESLGGGIASELAVRESIGGLVLQSTFVNIREIGAELFPWLPVRWIHTIRYDTLSKLPRVQSPVLVMHSRNDEVIGFHHGERLFAAANEPKIFHETIGGHGYSLPADHELCREGIERFLGLMKTASKAERCN